MLKQKKKFDVGKFLDRARNITGCDNDIELSKLCGFKSSNQVATYRHRGKLSMTGLSQILSSIKQDCNLNWLFYGEGEPYQSSEEGRYSDFLMRLLEELGLDTTSPEARTINNQFIHLINDIDDDETRRAQINTFLGTLFNYMITANNKREDE